MDSEYAQRYSDLYQRHWWWRCRERLILSTLRNYQSSISHSAKLSILDVGCGNGLFFSRLKEFGDVEGVEPDASIVDATAPSAERIHIGPFNQSFQPDKKYHWILMLDVLEHLDNPQRALKHALGLLAPGGRLLITVPAFRSLWTTHDDLNHHLTRYTRKTFAELAAEAQMHIEWQRYFFVWICPVKLAVRLKERFFPSQPRPVQVPSALVNKMCYALSRTEQILLWPLRLPFGSSLMIMGGNKPLSCTLSDNGKA